MTSSTCTVLQANYSQGSDIYPIESRGQQCVTNCFLFHALSSYKDLQTFDESNLDEILNLGDELYRVLQCSNSIGHNLLLCSDLPSIFRIGGKCVFKNILLNTYYGTMLPNQNGEIGISLENSLCASFAESTQCILIFHSSAVALVNVNEKFFIFDPHSRGRDSMCHAEGFGTLSCVASFPLLITLIRNICKSISNASLENVQFEVQSMKVYLARAKGKTSHVINVGGDHLQSFTLHTRKTSKRKSKIVNNLSSNMKRKKKSSESFHNDQKSVNQDLHTIHIQKFKQDVLDGPVYICTCCSQTWFRKSVVPASVKQTNLERKCYQGILSKDDKEWICNTCSNNLKNNKIPSCSAFNGMKFPNRPVELDLTTLEERLVSPRIPFMQLVAKPRGGQSSLRGNVVNVPSDVNSTVRILPRTLHESETVQVKLKRKVSYKHSVMHENVRPEKCIAALKWLLQHSQLYRNEGILIRDNWDNTQQNEWFDMVGLNSQENKQKLPVTTNALPSESYSNGQKRQEVEEQVQVLDTDKMDDLPDFTLKDMSVGNEREKTAVPSDSNLNAQDGHVQSVQFSGYG